MIKHRHLFNIAVVLLLALSMLLAPLQQIAFAEEDSPNTPEAVDAAMPPPMTPDPITAAFLIFLFIHSS